MIARLEPRRRPVCGDADQAVDDACVLALDRTGLASGSSVRWRAHAARLRRGAVGAVWRKVAKCHDQPVGLRWSTALLCGPHAPTKQSSESAGRSRMSARRDICVEHRAYRVRERRRTLSDRNCWSRPASERSLHRLNAPLSSRAEARSTRESSSPGARGAYLAMAVLLFGARPVDPVLGLLLAPGASGWGSDFRASSSHLASAVAAGYARS
jgi:hypothetical protein